MGTGRLDMDGECLYKNRYGLVMDREVMIVESSSGQVLATFDMRSVDTLIRN